MYIDYESYLPCYYIGTTAVLWFIQHNKIIANLYDFLKQ